MQFSIQASTLKPILSAIGKVIDAKPAMPIRECIYLHEQDGHIIATASNDGDTLSIVLPLDTVEDFQPICINYKQLVEITSAVGDSIFPMEFRTGRHAKSSTPFEMVIDYGEGEYRFLATDPTGYPLLKAAESTFQCDVPARSVFAAASTATAFTAKDDLRPVMAGVYFDFRKDGHLNIVATDSKALFQRTIADVPASSDCGIIIFPRTITIVNACIGSAETVGISVNGKTVAITTPTFRLESTLVEGRYPAYDRVIPRNQTLRIDTPVKAFVTAVRRAAICADSSTGQIRFDLVKGQTYAKVSASDIDYSKDGHTSLALPHPEQVTADLAIGFRASILLNAVAALPTADMQMCMTTSNRAATFESTDQTTLILVMPQAIPE